MVVDAERLGGPSTALNDPRLTPIGKFLRKYKLDELPQLFNILIGDMSIVGPRPQVEKYTRLYAGSEKAILSVKPGLTDYASIRFINLDAILGDDDVDEKYLLEIEPEKNRLRLMYANNHSFGIDMKIVFMTLVQLFSLRRKWNTQH
jgi:lipopolysaccharide/colanic/teichoic acid biosynthesis glycosyltransferase